MTFPLSPAERETLYYRLGEMGAFCGGEPTVPSVQSLPPIKILCLAAEESRYDPRLLGVLIDLLARRYRKIHPFSLAKAIRQMPTPQIWGVIAAFCKRLNRHADLRDFFAIVLRGLRPAPMQSYYNSQVRPRPEALIEDLVHAPDEFKRWGFFARFDPYLKERRPAHSPWSYSWPERQRILQHLFRKQRRIRMRDYLKAVDFTLSRQQAHHDLQILPGVKRFGKNRGAFYQLSI